MSSVVRETLAGYVAGRVKAEQLIALVTAAYYRDGSGGRREALRPVLDVIERASPGGVELAGAPDRPGFDVTPRHRPFPPQHEAELRRAAELYLGGTGGEAGSGTGRSLGLIARVRGALRRLLRLGR
jgi:hypothetical protein